MGNRTSVTNASGQRTTWLYDLTYQLTSERNGPAGKPLTYSYDAVGNRIWDDNCDTLTQPLPEGEGHD